MNVLNETGDVSQERRLDGRPLTTRRNNRPYVGNAPRVRR